MSFVYEPLPSEAERKWREEQKMEVKIQIVDWNTQGPLSYCETDGKILVEYKQEYYHLNVLKESLWLL